MTLAAEDNRIRIEELLDLTRRDVLTTTNDDILDPADAFDVPSCVHGSHISGVHQLDQRWRSYHNPGA